MKTAVGRSRLIRIIALGGAAFLLTSCAAPSPEAGDDSDPVAGATVVIAGPQAGDPYYSQVACGAQAAGAELGMEIGELQAPQNQNQAGLTTIVQNLLTTSPDALIYTPADPTAGAVPIQTALQDGVIVIDVDAKLDDASLYDSFVASDHYEGAKEITKWLADQIGGSGQIAAIGSLATNPITQARIKGFEDALKDYPDIEIVSTTYPEINPDIIALRNADLVGKVQMVSWDAGEANIKLLQEGVLQATVAQQPYKMGELAVEQIANKLRGDDVEATVASPVSILTAEDVDTPEGQALWYKADCS